MSMLSDRHEFLQSFWNSVYEKNESELLWQEMHWVDRCAKLLKEVIKTEAEAKFARILSSRNKTDLTIKVLDYACGKGCYIQSYLDVLSSFKNFTIVGADISSVAIKSAINKFESVPNVRFLGGVSLPEDVGECDFDIVICWSTLHHFDREYIGRCLKGFYDSLCVDGVLVLSGWGCRAERYSDGAGVSPITKMPCWPIEQIEPMLRMFFDVERHCSLYHEGEPIGAFVWYVCRKRPQTLLQQNENALVAYLQDVGAVIPFFHLFRFKISPDMLSGVMDRKESCAYYRDENEMIVRFATFVENLKAGCGEDRGYFFTRDIYSMHQKRHLFAFYEVGATASGLKIKETGNYRLYDFVNTESCEVLTNTQEAISQPLKKMTIEKLYEKINNSKVCANLTKEDFKHDKFFDDYAERFYYGLNQKTSIGVYFFVCPSDEEYDRQLGDGGLVLYATRRLPWDVLQNVDYLFSRWAATQTNRSFRRLLRERSVSCAVGAIMSRNGSHNIGSHVLSALTHNVGTMPDDRVLYQYIQHRMDYIASATTDFPDWSVPTKFVGEVMKLFYSQRHLLEHIAGSEGLHAYEFQGKGFDPEVSQHDCIKIIVRKVCEGNRGHGAEKEWSEFEFDKTRTLFVREFLCREGERISTDWANDVTLALPGGILGQHAFYNIVENIIRNAAKHAWSSLDSNRSDNPDNLEIYIDFKEDDDSVVSFTIGDNVSRLFPYGEFWTEFFNYLENNEQGQKLINNCDLSSEKEKGWLRKGLIDLEKLSSDSKKIPIQVETVKKAFAFALRYYPDELYLDQVRAYLEGGDAHSTNTLPPWYRLVQQYVSDNWQGRFSKDDKLRAILIGPDPGDGTLGRRLPVPLHHRQEIELAKPFIDLESNQLRQSSWGLAEMKISAGYLRRAKLSVVGGLVSDANNPLVIPIGIPLLKGPKEGGVDVLDLHMGYRFWISRPKSILIIADDVSRWKKFVGWTGVGVCAYADAMARVGLMADYGFVIVDHEFDLKNKEREEQNSLKLPFHAVFARKMDGRSECCDVRVNGGDFATVSQELIGKADTVRNLEECVYRVWLQFLKRRRGIGDKDLTIKIKISEDSGREQGLITDRDIWRVVFRECFHSVVEPLAEAPNLAEAERLALFLLSYFPIRVDDGDFDGVADVDQGLRIVLMRFEDFLFKVISWRKTYSVDNAADEPALLRMFLRGMADSRRTLLLIAIAEKAKRLLSRSPASEEDAGNQDAILLGSVYDVVRKMNRHSFIEPDHPLFQSVKEALLAANNTGDVFLRKYEERVSTLPTQYMATGSDGERETHNFTAVGVRVAVGSDDGADISYNRHDFDDSPVYSEPISGSQSYMNLLSSIKDDDVQLALRLAENGLLRILIVDERVCGFVTSRDKKISDIYKSMHISVADTRKGIRVDNPDNPLGNIEYAVRNGLDMQYDVLIIHQGVIDKWWPQHARADVAKLLKAIRASGFARFVVVTTGRGRPDNIPEDEKVLPFSSIEALLFRRYPEKLTLVNSLMNILPYESEKEE